MGSVRDTCSWLHVGLPSGAVSSAPAASGGGSGPAMPRPPRTACTSPHSPSAGLGEAARRSQAGRVPSSGPL